MLPVRAGWWVVSTVLLGALALFQATRFALRLHLALSEVVVCPRGHEVPLFGLYQCACHSVHEGYVFGRCRVCGERAGWTPCPVCQLPIQSPFV